MDLEFAKLHGAGNDFIFFDDVSQELELTVDQVAWLCDRYYGIGADGVILVRPPKRDGSVAYMHYINSDGTLAEMCGNGVRCFAKYLVDRGYVDLGVGRLVADTLAGERPISFITDERNALVSATVDMGIPRLQPEQVPTTLEANAQTDRGEPYVREAPLESPWGTFAFTCVSMGNPHAVCFIDDFDPLPAELFIDPACKNLGSLDIDRIGAFFEAHPAFPEKANIEFAVADEQGIAMRVFERGCGETLACGTGACATAVAATLTGRSDGSAEVNLRGGTLAIEWLGDGRVSMTGPAEESYTGTVRLSR